ncbi:MAG TPA: beta-propeller fold lactonase family protein [Polyangia bacterium]|nr:beta-propeller fold lactonase family protein [Polyangia bacterium]
MKKCMNLSRLGILALAPLAAAFVGTTGGCDNSGPPSYVYVLANHNGNNGVEAFRRDRTTGRLTRINRFPTGGEGFESIAGFGSNAIVSNGQYLFAVNPGSNTVSSLRIEQNGSLTLVSQEPTTGAYPATLTVNRDLLYVGSAGYSPGAGQAIEQGSYQGFRVGTNGTLTPLDCPVVQTNVNSTGGFTSGMVLNQDNTLFAGTVLLGDTLHYYNVDANGCLVNPKTMTGLGGPFSVIYRPSAPRELYVTVALPQFYTAPESLAPGVVRFDVDPAAATLTQRSVYEDADKTDTALRDPCWVLFAPDGRRFWTSSFIPRSMNLFTIDGQGQIQRGSEYQPNDSVPDPQDPSARVFVASEDVTIDTQGKFLYQLRSGAANPLFGRPVQPFITVLETVSDTSTNAGLREVQRLELPSDLVSNAGATGIVLVDR